MNEAETAPDFQLELFGTPNHQRGELISLSRFLGNPVVINFWFPSCPPCRAEMPDLEQAFQGHRADGVKFIGVQLVGLDTAEDGQEFVDSVGVTYALGADETADTIRDYEIVSFPSTIFLDRDHKVVSKWAGILTADKLEELIQQAMRQPV